jgi:hypothetical protein
MTLPYGLGEPLGREHLDGGTAREEGRDEVGRGARGALFLLEVLDGIDLLDFLDFLDSLDSLDYLVGKGMDKF